MTFVSYAQNFEDVLLERVFWQKTDGFYVDVGAYDPERFSTTKHFSSPNLLYHLAVFVPHLHCQMCHLDFVVALLFLLVSFQDYLFVDHGINAILG